MFKLDLEKSRGTRDQIANIHLDHRKYKRIPEKNIYFCFIDYAKAFDSVDHNKLWKEMGIADNLTFSCETCMQVRKQQLEQGIEQWTGSKLGKEYIKAVYCRSVYLNYMQSTSCEMSGCMKHKLELRLWEKRQQSQICRWNHPMAENKEKLKSFMMKVKEENEKAELKLNTQKTKIMVSGPITSWQIDGEAMETVTDFIFLGSKITVNSDCSHEIKRQLLLRRKAMTN